MGEVIFSYGVDEAVEDGVLIKVGMVGSLDVYFTSNLFYSDYRTKESRESLVEKGLKLLGVENQEDIHWKLRSIDDMFVVQNYGGITFMKKEDY